VTKKNFRVYHWIFNSITNDEGIFGQPPRLSALKGPERHANYG